VVVDRLLNHRTAFPVALSAVLAFSGWRGVRGSSRRRLVVRTVLITVLVLFGLGWAADGATAQLLDSPMRQHERVAGPAGTPLEAIAYFNNDVSSPETAVYLQNGRGLFARRWLAGCSYGESVVAMQWTAPDHVALTVTSAFDEGDAPKTILLTVDLPTGRPAKMWGDFDDC
jgi:hypothetical protein